MADIEVMQFTPLNKIQSNSSDESKLIDQDEAEKTANVIIEKCLLTPTNDSSIISNDQSLQSDDVNTSLDQDKLNVIGNESKTSDENHDPTLKPVRVRKPKRKNTTSQSESAKKAFKGIRSDCPTFCRSGCTYVHHELLVSARKMVENDSKTTMIFLDKVRQYYETDDIENPRKTSELIYDPSKNTEFPLLHYLALMGKCSGCFALVDFGHDPKDMLTITKDSVLHTMVRELYNFNCTHGHMDILLKKFKLLLKEFHSCLLFVNIDKQTCIHLCASLITVNSQLLNTRKPPYRYYQFLKNMLKSLLDQFLEDGHDKSLLNTVDSDGNTPAHYLAADRAAVDLLDLLRSLDVDFTIKNKDGETVDDIMKKAPDPPSEEMLELALFSNQSNKYKAAVSKPPRPTKNTSPNSKEIERGPNKRIVKKRDFGNEFLSPDDPKKFKFENNVAYKIKFEKPNKKKSKNIKLKILKTETEPPQDENFKTVITQNTTPPPTMVTTVDTVSKDIALTIKLTKSPLNKTPKKETNERTVSPEKTLSPAAKILLKFAENELSMTENETPRTLKDCVSKTPVATFTSTTSSVCVVDSLSNQLTNTTSLSTTKMKNTKKQAINHVVVAPLNFEGGRNPHTLPPLKMIDNPANIVIASSKVVLPTSTVTTPSQKTSITSTLNKTVYPSVKNVISSAKPPKKILPAPTVTKTSKAPEFNPSMIANVRTENSPTTTTAETFPLITNVKSLKEMLSKDKSINNSIPSINVATYARPLLPKTTPQSALNIPDMSGTKHFLNQQRAQRPVLNNRQVMVRASNGQVVTVNLLEKAIAEVPMQQQQQQQQQPQQQQQQQQQQSFRYPQPMLRSGLFVAPNGMRYFVPAPHAGFNPRVSMPNGPPSQYQPQPMQMPMNSTMPNQMPLCFPSRVPFMSFPRMPYNVVPVPQASHANPTMLQPFDPRHVSPLGYPPQPPEAAGIFPSNNELITSETFANSQSKNKKSKNLEDRISKLMKKTNSEPLSPNEITELKRLTSKIDESAPPVIILDGDDDDDDNMTDDNSTSRESFTNGTSVEETSKITSSVNERNLTEQKVFSDIREKLLWQLLQDQKSVDGINEEILRVENHVVNTQNLIAEKEKEIKTLKSQVRNKQDLSKKLRHKRADLINRVTRLEESVKSMDQKKSLPQSNHCNI